MKRAWWKGSCGHSWNAIIYNRTVNGEGCLECEKEFKSVLPQLAVLYYAGKYGLKAKLNPLIWSQQFEKAQTNRKSRFTQHLAERIEIPFRSKKLCKSALLQSLSLFVRRTVNRLKTGGRRRRLVAAEALAATQAYRSPWREPRIICASRIFSCVLPEGSMGYYSKNSAIVKSKCLLD